MSTNASKQDKNLDSLILRLVVIFTALSCIALFLPALQGQSYYFDDFRDYHLPLRYFYAKCLSSDQLFVWCPNIFNGYYLHADGQVGMYHPLHLFLYRCFQFTTAFNIEFCLNYIFAFAGTFFFLKRWGFTLSPALFGAFTFSFCGFNLLHLMHINAVAVISHIPWILLSIDLIMREKAARSAYWTALTALTASQLLHGHPQSVYLSLMTEFFYITLLMTCRGKIELPGETLARHRIDSWAPINGRSLALNPAGGTQRLGLVIAAKITGCLIGAVQLLPTADGLMNSTRKNYTLSTAASAEFAGSGSLSPINIVQLWSPYLFQDRQVGFTTHEFSIYNGIIGIFAILWICANWRSLGQLKRLAGGAIVLGVVGMLLSLGENTALHKILISVPYLNVFRMPVRHIVLYHFASAILIAIFLTDLHRATERGQTKNDGHFRLLACIPGISALTALAATVMIVTDYRLSSQTISPSLLAIWYGPLISSLIFVCIALSVKGKRLYFAILVLLALIDQSCYAITYLHNKSVIDYQSILEYDVSKRKNEYPLYSRINELIVYDLKLVFGYAGLYPERRVSRTSLARLRGLARASLLTETRVPSDYDVELEAIDINQVALVDTQLDLPAGPSGIVTILSDRPGHIKLLTDCRSRQLLVLNERYHEGWRAITDSGSTEVIRVFGEYLGCVVDNGAREIILKFDPQSLRLGKIVSCTGIAIWALLVCSIELRLGRTRKAVIEPI